MTGPKGVSGGADTSRVPGDLGHAAAVTVLHGAPPSSRYQLGLVKKIAVVAVPMAGTFAAGWNKVLAMADPQTVSDLHHMHDMHSVLAMVASIFGVSLLAAGLPPNVSRPRLSVAFLLAGAACMSVTAYNVARIYGNTTVDGLPCDPSKEVYVSFDEMNHEDEHSPLTCTLAAPVTQDPDNDATTDNSLTFRAGRGITAVDGKIVEGTLDAEAPFGDLRASASVHVALGCKNDVVCFGYDNQTGSEELNWLSVAGAPGMNDAGEGTFHGGCVTPHAKSPNESISGEYLPGCDAQNSVRYYGANRPAVETWRASARTAVIGQQNVALAEGERTWNPDGTLRSAILAGPTKFGRATFKGEITLHHNGEVANGLLAEPLDLGIGTLPVDTEYTQDENETPISAAVSADEQTIRIDGHYWSSATLHFAGRGEDLHIASADLNAAHSYRAETPSGIVTYPSGGTISFSMGEVIYTPTTGGRGF